MPLFALKRVSRPRYMENVTPGLYGQKHPSRDYTKADCWGKNQFKVPLTVAEALGDKIDIEYYYRHPRSYVRRGVFSVHEPSPTVRGVNRPLPEGYKLHPNDPVTDLKGLRPLTARERSLIQTFPEDFIFSGTKTSIEQMVGNAVPVNLGKYVATCIEQYIADHSLQPKAQGS